MIENRILVPIDFTDAADKAIEFAAFLASKCHGQITLLHVFEDGDLSIEACDAKLKTISDKLNAEEDISSDFICEKGNIFNIIPDVASKNNFRLMILGTHGRKGLREKFFGVDILKLLKKVCIPSMVVQAHSTIPAAGFNKTVFPVGGHDEYVKMIDAMFIIAGIFDPEIYLYSISKAGFEQTEKLKENIKLAEQRFSEKGINYKRVSEDQNVFSVGFAKQTLKYSAQIGADLIAMMASQTRENYYFADSDKEAILTNENGIPVLCASNAEVKI
jgi:nucleotide-binding universal stress UspA family protein